MTFEEVSIGGCQSYLLGSTAAVRVSWADEGSPTQSLAIECWASYLSPTYMKSLSPGAARAKAM